jgi:hypothetical protein
MMESHEEVCHHPLVSSTNKHIYCSHRCRSNARLYRDP